MIILLPVARFLLTFTALALLGAAAVLARLLNVSFPKLLLQCRSVRSLSPKLLRRQTIIISTKYEVIVVYTSA